MSVHLKRRELPGEGIWRVCCEHADKALAGLKRGDRLTGVHDTRKEIKKLRAVFRLAQGGMSRGDYRKLAKTMRLAAKPLAGIRDARVTQRALQKAAGQQAERRFPTLATALDLNFRLESRRFTASDFGGVAQFVLRKLGKGLKRVEFKGDDWGRIEPDLMKSYSRALDGYELAKLSPSVVHLHEWRKQAKKLWYQLDFLCPDWPARTQVLVDGLEKLTEQLGDDHDLVLLQQFASDHCAGDAETAKLNEIVGLRRQKAIHQIQQAGRRFFAGDAKAMCARWGKDWQRWRDA